MKKKKKTRRHSMLSAAGCKCVHNKRTGRSVKLCPKSSSRSGWSFVKGGC
jgi:hypothetical protein